MFVYQFVQSLLSVSQKQEMICMHFDSFFFFFNKGSLDIETENFQNITICRSMQIIWSYILRSHLQFSDAYKVPVVYRGHRGTTVCRCKCWVFVAVEESPGVPLAVPERRRAASWFYAPLRSAQPFVVQVATSCRTVKRWTWRSE